jgi:hypothetical protein
VHLHPEFFGDIGSPGSARGVDLTYRDHPLVAALPARQRG